MSDASKPDPLGAALLQAIAASDDPRVRAWLLALAESGERGSWEDRGRAHPFAPAGTELARSGDRGRPAGRPVRFPRETSRNVVRGFVYLLGPDPTDGAFKIGATNKPGRRLREIRAGARLPSLSVCHLVPSRDCFWIEQTLHRHFAARRVGGEWFALTEQDVMAFKLIGPANSPGELPPRFQPLTEVAQDAPG